MACHRLPVERFKMPVTLRCDERLCAFGQSMDDFMSWTVPKTDFVPVNSINTGTITPGKIPMFG